MKNEPALQLSPVSGAEYVNKTRILTCMLEYLNRKKVLRAKILMQNVLKRQIPPRNFTEERWERASVIFCCIPTFKEI